MINLKPLKLERKIIKLMLSKNKTYSYIEDKLNAKYLALKENRIIFSFFQEYYRRYNVRATCKIFLRMIKNKDEKALNKYKLILQKIIKENVRYRELPYFIEEIIKSYKSRIFLKMIYYKSDMIQENKVDEAIEGLQHDLTKLKQVGSINIIREGGYLESVEQRAKELSTKSFYFGNHVGVPTGLRIFDNFYGGIFPEELGIIVGGTGKGKSILLLNIAIKAALLKLPVVIVTIEMGKLQYEYRLDSRLTKIMQNKFRKKELTKEETQLWLSKMKKFKNYGKIYIIDIPKGATTNLIELKLQEAERYLKSKKYLLVVDYLNLLLPNRAIKGSKHDWQPLGEITEDLKVLARMKHIPIWTASQLTNETSKKKTLGVEDIGYSSLIGQGADFGLGLVQTPEMEEEGILKVFCLKGREGKIPTMEMYPDFSRMIFNMKDYNEDGE